MGLRPSQGQPREGLRRCLGGSAPAKCPRALLSPGPALPAAWVRPAGRGGGLVPGAWGAARARGWGNFSNSRRPRAGRLWKDSGAAAGPPPLGPPGVDAAPAHPSRRLRPLPGGEAGPGGKRRDRAGAGGGAAGLGGSGRRGPRAGPRFHGTRAPRGRLRRAGDRASAFWADRRPRATRLKGRSRERFSARSGVVLGAPRGRDPRAAGTDWGQRGRPV